MLNSGAEKHRVDRENRRRKSSFCTTHTHRRERGCIYMIVEAYRNSAGSHFFCLEKGERKQQHRRVPWGRRTAAVVAKLLLVQRTVASQQL